MAVDVQNIQGPQQPIAQPQPVQASVQASAPTASQAVQAIEQMVVKEASLVPEPWRMIWLSALLGALMLFIGYILVADVSFANPEARSMVHWIGDKWQWFALGLALPSPVVAAVATARKS